MVKNKIFILIFIFALFSCKKNFVKEENSSDKITIKGDTLNITYHENQKIKELELSEYEGKKNVKLSFLENGRLKQKTINFNSYPTINYEYDESEKLVHEWKEDDIGGCIAISGDEFFWNKEGYIIKEINHNNFGKSCSEKILVRQIKEFFENSKKIKSLYYTRESYEGSEECPCGLRKEFDKSGKVINQKEFIKCNSATTECDEKTLITSKVISNKWYGKYKLSISGQGNREGNQYLINLLISKDSIIYSAEGYQIYHKFSLDGEENKSKLDLKFLEAQDGTNSWALKKTHDFGKIIIENGKYFWTSPFLDISYTDNKPVRYQLQK